MASMKNEKTISLSMAAMKSEGGDSGYSNYMYSYKARLNPEIQDSCPHCNSSHTPQHLFNCLNNQTYLTTNDLWNRPTEAARFLNLASDIMMMVDEKLRAKTTTTTLANNMVSLKRWLIQLIWQPWKVRDSCKKYGYHYEWRHYRKRLATMTCEGTHARYVATMMHYLATMVYEVTHARKTHPRTN